MQPIRASGTATDRFRPFPGQAGAAALYLVERDFLHTPVAPLLAPDAINAWNTALATPTP
ncbi:hypothetical protein AB0I10_26535 [Streptomyces sp. NPDC050636]|uniref:hypothetical protein n=1 Tax=Streptomyces sp. NPDC050636 TaxID=3154510 RepID=UPI00343DC1C6